MRRRRFLMVTAATAASSLVYAAPAPQRIVLAGLVTEADRYAAEWLTLIYTEAFRQLGVALEIRNYPASRASAEALAGNVDGEMVRNLEYQEMQQVLVRVPEPTMFVTTASYVHRPDVTPAAGWEGLRDTRYHVEYRAGYMVMGKKLAAVVPAANLTSVRSAQLGLRKLALGRIDLYVDNIEVVEPLLSSDEFRTLGIRQASVIERSAVYCYLNRKHADLAGRLGVVLKKMRESGLIERYRRQALADSR
ncbi:hypothetical protein SAMN05192549_102294 [Duganella sacchari]|uniref:ABC-type amino acid transport substrate-binding protein n=2 Tax=Duganella sacchari TaxID=551987 RepID=A0A1M7L072_9BURK|nr:hypothetical protein SAMN05192549_102294 [Duganella sacchari]